MSWLVDLRRFAKPGANRIGPGRLVLVVGPSGAGKDTLIAGTRRACANDPSVVFPRRTITRPPSASEDNAIASEQSFNQSVADGEFALWWDAHGHRYGVPLSIDDDIRAERAVVCNVSRTIVGFAKRRYASVAVVLVTAPSRVLEARLANRDRPSDGALANRLARSATVGETVEADFVIHNVGSAEMGIRRLLNVIHDHGYFIAF